MWGDMMSNDVAAVRGNDVAAVRATCEAHCHAHTHAILHTCQSSLAHMQVETQLSRMQETAAC